LPGVAGGLDRPLHLARATLVNVGEDVALLVRHDDLGRLSGLDRLPADHERELDALGLHLVEPATELLALRRAGRVVLDRLVDRLRRAEDPRRAHAGILRFRRWLPRT
jgi:hypothetical protein